MTDIYNFMINNTHQQKFVEYHDNELYNYISTDGKLIINEDISISNIDWGKHNNTFKILSLALNSTNEFYINNFSYVKNIGIFHNIDANYPKIELVGVKLMRMNGELPRSFDFISNFNITKIDEDRECFVMYDGNEGPNVKIFNNLLLNMRNSQFSHIQISNVKKMTFIVYMFDTLTSQNIIDNTQLYSESDNSYIFNNTNNNIKYISDFTFEKVDKNELVELVDIKFKHPPLTHISLFKHTEQDSILSTNLNTLLTNTNFYLNKNSYKLKNVKDVKFNIVYNNTNNTNFDVMYNVNNEILKCTEWEVPIDIKDDKFIYMRIKEGQMSIY